MHLYHLHNNNIINNKKESDNLRVEKDEKEQVLHLESIDYV